MSCIIIFYSMFQITKANIKPQRKRAVSVTIADGHFNLPQGLCGYVWVNTPTSSFPVHKSVGVLFTSIPVLNITCFFALPVIDNVLQNVKTYLIAC